MYDHDANYSRNTRTNDTLVKGQITFGISGYLNIRISLTLVEAFVSGVDVVLPAAPRRPGNLFPASDTLR